MKKLWQEVEKEFETTFQSQFGKAGFLYRFRDASDAFGRNGGRVIKVTKQPADYLLCYYGITSFAEVKSTTGKSFSFSNIQDCQLGTATRCVAASSHYIFWIKNPDGWHRVHATDIVAAIEDNKGSIQLEPYRLRDGKLSFI